MLYLKDKSMQSLYSRVVKEVLRQSHSVGNTTEVNNAILELTDPTNNIATSRGKGWGIDLGYALAEMAWYFSGHHDVKFISQFGSMWSRLTDDGLTNNSGYGYLIYNAFGFDQIEKVVDILTKDPDSRRAKININTPRKNVDTTHDEPCTMFLQFLIRDKKLQMTTVMRSNDLWYGTPYDILFFTSMQQVIASYLNLKCGTYTHMAVSLHIYDKDAVKLSRAVHENNDERNYRIDALAMCREASYLYFKAYNEGKNAKTEIINTAKKVGII